jgi:hypothetical protein
MNDHWKVISKVYVFHSDRKSKMAATAVHRLTLNPMGKCSNAFSETTNMIKAQLYMNVHWMVLYKLYVFCSEEAFLNIFPIGSNVKISPVVAAILNFISEQKTYSL